MDNLKFTLNQMHYKKINTLKHIYYTFHPNNTCTSFEYYQYHFSYLIEQCFEHYDITILEDCLFNIHRDNITQEELFDIYLKQLIYSLEMIYSVTFLINKDNIASLSQELINPANIDVTTLPYNSICGILTYIHLNINSLLEYVTNVNNNKRCALITQLNCFCYACLVGR